MRVVKTVTSESDNAAHHMHEDKDARSSKDSTFIVATAEHFICDDDALIKPLLDSLPPCITADQCANVESLLFEYITTFACHEYDEGKPSL